MAEDKDPFAEFGGSKVIEEKDPFAEFGGSKLRGKPLDIVLPTGTKTSKSGSLPFQTQVDTKAPSVLLSDAQKQQREQERIGKRFETTLLNIPTEFGRVAPAMKAAKQIQETLPEVPSLRKYGEIPRMQPTAMTEGQRLGESLTEGTDFQELTTDKFTEKKTGLQKQIENAENAFRAYQGDEIANQVQSYIPPEETLKIKQELGFDEKMSNVGSNFVNRLERFAPNTALAVGQTLTTLLGEDYGGEAYRMITGGVGNAEIHRMEAFDKLAKLDAEYKYSKGLIQSVQDLDLGGVAAGITDAVGSLVSTIITSAPTAGLGLYSDMVGSGLYDYNSAKANRLGITVDELYDSSQNEFFVPAILGGVGAQLEKIGLKGIKTAIMSNMAKGAGQKFALIGHNMNKEGVTELLQTGLEEVSNTLAQGKSVAEATLEFGKTLFSKKGAESYLMGVVASGSAIGGGRILKGLFSNKSKKQATTAIQAIEQQQTELSNPDLSEESRTFIYENIKNNVAELVDAVDNDVNETEGLSEDQKREVNNLNTKIQAFQVVINDPAASEETKNRARKVSEETQAKIDDIINKKPPIVPPATGGAMMEAEPIAKPTFDTEQQITEEAQQAEAEFNQTDDLVTYEQKMKELNDRANNLVPAPEDAEIGKPEDKDTPRKVIYVQKVFPDKGNENLTERQIGSIEKAIDAGIKAGKSGNEIYGILNALGFAPANIAGLQENLREYLNNRVEGKDNRTFQETQTKPQEDAIQVETAGQVPVLTEATVSEEVEQGKPEAKPKVVTEEGVKAEEVISDTGVSLDVIVDPVNIELKNNKIEGKLFNEQESVELQKEIESKYNNSDTPINKRFGQENEDIRQNAFNYDSPAAQKNVNGVDVRIVEGLVEGKAYSGKRRQTYLLYADGKIAGKFYSLSDAKKVVNFIEANLVKSLPTQEQTPPALRDVESTAKAFTIEEDKKIKDIAIEANTKVGNYVKRVPTGKKDKFSNNINEFEATNPFTDEKKTFKKQSEATEYVINEIAKANTKKGREEIFQSLLSKEQTPAQQVEQLRAEEQAIEAVDYKGKKISDVKIGDVYYNYYAGAIRKFERLPNQEKENGEEVYFSKVVDENTFSKGSPDDVIGFNESDYLKSRPAETFLENAEDLFYKNPLLDFLEVFGTDGKLVGYVALNKVDSDTVDVDNVVSMTGGERKGGGSQIMKMVTKNADQTGVTLILVPEPLPRRAIEGFDTPEKLQAFYEKFGFVKDKKKPTMTRKPQPVLPQTIDEQIAELRIKEQVELRKYLKKYTFEEYLTDGKIDRDKITDAKDLKKFDEIYDKYDKLITPLLPKKEAPAPKQEAPAKAEPKLKSKVATRLLFKKAVDLFYDISAADGSAKKGRLARDRQKFLAQNPSIKYIDDNWPNISKQLKEKGLLEKSKGCP